MQTNFAKGIHTYERYSQTYSYIEAYNMPIMYSDNWKVGGGVLLHVFYILLGDRKANKYLMAGSDKNKIE